MSFGFGFGLPSWQALSGGFTPASLFSAGEQGAWYDPSDYSTLFTDSAGTTPVTAVEQFVGLMLDKSKGAPTTLGAELNGDPSLTGNGFWGVNPGVTVGSNKVSFVSTGVGNALFKTTLLTPGKWYRITLTIANYAAGAVGVETPSPQSAVFSANGTYSCTVFANAATALYITARNATTTLDITAISVREIPGNHATSTGTKRPKLAARYNLLTYSEQFDNAVWNTGGPGTTVVPNAAIAPSGEQTADEIISAGANSSRFTTVTATNTTHTMSFWVRAGTKTTCTFGVYTTAFVAATATVVSGSGTITGTTTFTVSGLTSAWTRIVLTTSAAIPAGSTSLFFYPGSISSSAGDSVYLWGADLRPTSQATGLIGPTYQRVAAATDYDTVGFLPYLAFDGVDDSMSTGSIDFTATDKMTVFAGVRKLSDAALGFLAELSNSLSANNGSFWLINGDGQVGAGPTWQFVSKGTNAAFATSPASYASPITNVLTGVGNILSDVATLRVNGTQVASSTADQGTSNYGNYPLFIGQRNNTSLPFNGWMSSLIIRGAQSTDSQISATESWVAGKTGVSL